MKQVRHIGDGTLAEVVAEEGDYYRLNRPLTSPKKYWEEHTPEPEIGDIWAWAVTGSANYRCLGVDKARGVAHWVSARRFHEGGYPVDFEVQAHPAPEVAVYTRALPEIHLKLKERP